MGGAADDALYASAARLMFGDLVQGVWHGGKPELTRKDISFIRQLLRRVHIGQCVGRPRRYKVVSVCGRKAKNAESPFKYILCVPDSHTDVD